MKAGNRVPDPARIERFQVCAATKHDITGPFTLRDGPVILRRIARKDGVVDGVKAVGQLAQQAGPVGPELLIEQRLRLGHIRYPREAIVASLITQSGLVHLPGQPLAAVEANVHPEWKPGLDAGVHEAEHGMYLVMVEVDAFAFAVVDLQVFASSVSVNCE